MHVRTEARGQPWLAFLSWRSSGTAHGAHRLGYAAWLLTEPQGSAHLPLSPTLRLWTAAHLGWFFPWVLGIELRPWCSQGKKHLPYLLSHFSNPLLSLIFKWGTYVFFHLEVIIFVKLVHPEILWNTNGSLECFHYRFYRSLRRKLSSCFVITQGVASDSTFLPFPFMSSLRLDFPMNLKHVQCRGKRIICFNFIAKNRWGPFLFLECYTG